MIVGKLNPQGKLNFPGFQEILDFTSAGSESSVSVTVDGDTDKEYKILVRSTDSADIVRMALNNDTTAANYGRQYIYNNSGTITAARDTSVPLLGNKLANSETSLLTPSGFIKTLFNNPLVYSTGTTIQEYFLAGQSYNSTANITSLNFYMSSGNFTSGTRISVFARRAYP